MIFLDKYSILFTKILTGLPVTGIWAVDECILKNLYIVLGSIAKTFIKTNVFVGIELPF